jgi:hypothetical protein
METKAISSPPAPCGAMAGIGAVRRQRNARDKNSGGSGLGTTFIWHLTVMRRSGRIVGNAVIRRVELMVSPQPLRQQQAT